MRSNCVATMGFALGGAKQPSAVLLLPKQTGNSTQGGQESGSGENFFIKVSVGGKLLDILVCEANVCCPFFNSRPCLLGFPILTNKQTTFQILPPTFV